MKNKSNKITKEFLKDLNKKIEKDKLYFKIQVEKGITRLVGNRTEGRVRNCIHCKLWNKTDKFIKEILKEEEK